MHRPVRTTVATLAAFALMLPPAGASRVWEWSEPVNVGQTNFEDLFPALSSDDDTLIFASTRPKGSGGNDLYVTTRRRP